MSETLSGVTLLALANGANDVIASFLAAKIKGGISLSVGALFGAHLFVTSVVFGRVIYLSQSLEVAP